MDLIYQPRPLDSKLSMFRPKSWTESVQSYINEAKQLTMCIIRNRKLLKKPYTWLVTINFEDELEPSVVTTTWTKVARRLRQRGIICLWVREPSRANTVHYHLLLTNGIQGGRLSSIIDECMPQRSEMRWHSNLTPLDDDWWVAFYVTKAKVAGKVDGEQVEDRYGEKRRLFQPRIKLQKYGTIGKFWVKPKKVLWKEIAAEEKQIAEAIERQDVRRYVKHIYELLCETVSIKEIERSIGLHAHEPSLLAYIEKLGLTDEPHDYWACIDE